MKLKKRYKEHRKTQMKSILEKATSEHIDFLCLPEGFLTGYYAQEGTARKNSLEVGGAAFEEWLEILKNFSSTIIVGFNERDGNRIFDSAAIIENGKLLGVNGSQKLAREIERLTKGSNDMKVERNIQNI